MKSIPEATVDRWRSLRRQGLSFREIAEVTGAVRSTISNHLAGVEIARQRDPTKYEPSYLTPESVETDDGWHLSRIAEANDGYGFPVVTEPLLTRLYLLEVAPAQPRWFWRAA